MGGLVDGTQTGGSSIGHQPLAAKKLPKAYAGQAVKGACWHFALSLTVFLAIAETIRFFAWRFFPEARLWIGIAGAVVMIWLFLRIMIPTVIRLQQHYRHVLDSSVSPDPALAKAIVKEQWAYLRHDLALPWRAIRG